MEVRRDWRRVLQRTWSVRFIVIAALLSGTEAALPYIHELGLLEFLPGGVFALVTFVVVMAAFISRFIAQGRYGYYAQRQDED